MRPGKLLFVDTHKQIIEEDDDLKMKISTLRAHKKLTQNRVYLDQIIKDDVV